MSCQRPRSYAVLALFTIHYSDRDTSSNVPRSGYITARDQSMVESGVTEGGKNAASE